MQMMTVFPTCIGVQHDTSMAERILPIAKKYLSDESKLTYTWNYKNTYTKNLHVCPEDLDFFSKYISDIGNQFLNNMGYSKRSFKTQIFFSEMLSGDRHEIHTHPNCILSGVFYLEVPEGSSDIKFYDPTPFKKIMRLDIENESNNLSWDWFKIKPEKGMILIWKSHIEHEVLINQSDSGRITAVFNLI
jgi:uncharacterized protein (TIGR02466 family)